LAGSASSLLLYIKRLAVIILSGRRKHCPQIFQRSKLAISACFNCLMAYDRTRIQLTPYFENEYNRNNTEVLKNDKKNISTTKTTQDASAWIQIAHEFQEWTACIETPDVQGTTSPDRIASNCLAGSSA
jgi:hypothetical protein